MGQTIKVPENEDVYNALSLEGEIKGITHVRDPVKASDNREVFVVVVLVRYKMLTG